jgi:murein DD-endopeptidase MepM/ murein hydrolase activator NlpD
VLVSAAGEIVAVVDGQVDNPPGQVGGAEVHPAGNHVVIQTAPDEYVFLAHFQSDTIHLTPGDTVAAGDLLGLAGNSGNSSEPHLHIHIQTEADFFDPTAQSVPLVFDDYLADGQPVAAGVPRQGQFIAPADD